MNPSIEQNNNEDLNLMQRQEGNDTLKSLENTSEMALLQREETNTKLDDINRTLELQIEQEAESKNEVKKVQLVAEEVEDDEDRLANTFYKMLRGKKGEKGEKGDKGDQGIQGEKGERGEDGYTPIKGRDYFDGEKGEKGDTGATGPQGPMGLPGKDGIDGKDGKPADIKEIKKLIPKPETTETIIEKIKDKFSFTDLKDIPMYLRKVASKTVSLIELDDVQIDNPTQGQALTYSATLRKWINTAVSAGSGDVTGPASSTDNAITRFDGTTGKLIQNSVSTIDDNGILSTTSGIISGTNGNGHINLRHQASDAVATGQSTAIFADSNGDFKYKNDGNYYTTLKTSTNTADRTYTYPDATGSLALKNTIVANQIAYATDTNTFGSLDTATYPSLTEISYVKGVTSPIQTQLNAKVDDSEKGANNGIATLDSGGKVPASQLPSTVMNFKGTWDATTNTPTLADGVGDAGDVYTVSVAGTQNLGSGPITFSLGDWAVYNGTIWQKSDNSDDVTSVNGQQGTVLLDTGDISDTTNKRYVTDAQLVVIGNTSGTNTGNETTTTVGSLINGATGKTTPVDADSIGLVDSEASNVLKKLTWANLKATLKTYFDTLYAPVGGGSSNVATFSQSILSFSTETYFGSSFTCAAGGFSTTEPIFHITRNDITRYIKQSSGGLVVTHKAFINSQTSGGQGKRMCVVGNYLYVIYYDGGTGQGRILRLDKDTLLNPTQMTVSGIALYYNGGIFSDGTYIYHFASGSDVYKYTISGTTLTSSFHAAFSGLGASTNHFWCNGTHVYESIYSSTPTTKKHTLAGSLVSSYTSLGVSLLRTESGDTFWDTTTIGEANNTDTLYLCATRYNPTPIFGKVVAIPYF